MTNGKAKQKYSLINLFLYIETKLINFQGCVILYKQQKLFPRN